MGLEDLKKRECSKHSFETISGYCFECCTLVCIRCILETHGEHKEKVNFLEESVLKKRNEVVKIGERLEKRLIVVERKRRRIEQEVKELEEKLEKKRIEKKEIEMEKEDLRIRQDSIIRLSNTPTDVSLFDDQLFSTLLQTANDIVSEEGVGLKPKKGVLFCGSDSFCFISSFRLKNKSRGVSVNSNGNIFICEDGGGLRVRDKEGNEIEAIQKTIDLLQLKPVDVSIGLNDQIVVLDYSRSCTKVVVLNEVGELLESFGSRGSQNGQFNQPYGVDVDGKVELLLLTPTIIEFKCLRMMDLLFDLLVQRVLLKINLTFLTVLQLMEMGILLFVIGGIIELKCLILKGILFDALEQKVHVILN